MPHVELPQAEFKVVMLGDTFTGKTSLVLRFAEGHYRESSRSPTVGAFFITKRLTVKGTTCKMQIWDTAGQEQFKRLAPMYYKGCAAAIICYDPTSPKSFENLKYWIDELQRNVSAGSIVISMCATKCDLVTMPNPVHTQVEHLAQLTQHRHITTSAKNDENVRFLFEQVAERVLQFQKQNKDVDIPVSLGTTPIRVSSKLKHEPRSIDMNTLEGTPGTVTTVAGKTPKKEPTPGPSTPEGNTMQTIEENRNDEEDITEENARTRGCDSASMLMCGDNNDQNCSIS